MRYLLPIDDLSGTHRNLVEFLVLQIVPQVPHEHHGACALLQEMHVA